MKSPSYHRAIAEVSGQAKRQTVNGFGFLAFNQAQLPAQKNDGFRKNGLEGAFYSCLGKIRFDFDLAGSLENSCHPALIFDFATEFSE
ncbi:MAG: hypothetical protein WBM67_20070 [Sedimenticolaceae bacterium]